ncbi:TPA: capsular biosynthesis protein CpsC [Streptococcus suis]|uniref:Capsular polysaccharide biosynthesis protein CpsC n=1 Tax=Streptococcus suis TaxID=1307 RepID=A0A288W6P9_STRSU|nr:Wzz/FepE/Etk N-terminal domain-containing protein [Streptococcus suis]ARO73589.1 chain length determinant protein Wzd [Streptococcus suis]MCK3975535.1 capsular biosynthesis protein CpsC [Streptococcus suis]MDW8590306.1 Wzz/FepE/Etk N-terminal domain-containing protein [Streptococcus suis]MDW8615201.1 Wzz/FepE/Etk N-terminal domain-containing protein [Streptococcus suis]MDW8767174.1 Wzz/FepE/Etk N-terminal domain-containing protein [Streptococcus suis]
MNNQESNTIEIDVLSLLKTIWRKKFFILVTAVLGAGLAFVYSSFLVTPQYDSTTRIYVVSQNVEAGAGLTNQDLQAGSYLVKDYKEIILSQDVLTQVATELNLNENLKEKVSVSIPVDTRIVSISVRDADPNEAARIANSLRTFAAQKIVEVTKVSDVTTLEEAVPAEKPTTPNTKRNIILGLLAGGILATALVLVMEVLDDRVKRPQDIEEVMGLTLLGVVPDSKKLK